MDGGGLMSIARLWGDPTAEVAIGWLVGCLVVRLIPHHQIFQQCEVAGCRFRRAAGFVVLIHYSFFFWYDTRMKHFKWSGDKS